MTFKNLALPAMAVAGLAFAIVVAIGSQKKTPPAQPLAQPAQAPFKSYIGGAGMVEARTENISIGTSVGGIVKDLYVEVGDRVKTGAPLFLIDDRELRAELPVKQAGLLKARTALEEAKASLKDYQSQYALVRNMTDRRAVSVDEVQKRQNAELLAEARVESAKAAVAAAEAEIKSTQTAIDRLTVRAPMEGEILQVNIRPGEYAPTGALSRPLIRMGNMDRLHIRVDIDENDAWRFHLGSRAVAFLRGNRDFRTDLVFVRVEPYVTPKTSLTGSSTERVDTRVLQVIYSFDRSAMPVFVGQQTDIFIEAPEVEHAPTPVAGAQSRGGNP